MCETRRIGTGNRSGGPTRLVGGGPAGAARPLAIVGGTLVDLADYGNSTQDVRDAVVVIGNMSEAQKEKRLRQKQGLRGARRDDLDEDFY